jgi:hypothetical protein
MHQKLIHIKFKYGIDMGRGKNYFIFLQQSWIDICVLCNLI